jgi:hypothetical protein
VGRPGGKRLQGRQRNSWEENIKINLKGDRMGWYGLD